MNGRLSGLWCIGFRVTARHTRGHWDRPGRRPASSSRTGQASGEAPRSPPLASGGVKGRLPPSMSPYKPTAKKCAASASNTVLPIGSGQVSSKDLLEVLFHVNHAVRHLPIEYVHWGRSLIRQLPGSALLRHRSRRSIRALINGRRSEGAAERHGTQCISGELTQPAPARTSTKRDGSSRIPEHESEKRDCRGGLDRIRRAILQGNRNRTSLGLAAGSVLPPSDGGPAPTGSAPDFAAQRELLEAAPHPVGWGLAASTTNAASIHVKHCRGLNGAFRNTVQSP